MLRIVRSLQPATLAISTCVKHLSRSISRMRWCCDLARFGAIVEGARSRKKLEGRYFDRHVRAAYVAGSVGIAPELVGPLISYSINQEATTRFFWASTKYLKYSISSCAWLSDGPASHPNGRKCSRETASLVVWPCPRYPQYTQLLGNMEVDVALGSAWRSEHHNFPTHNSELNHHFKSLQLCEDGGCD
jgi:hypothetical protein